MNIHLSLDSGIVYQPTNVVTSTIFKSNLNMCTIILNFEFVQQGGYYSLDWTAVQDYWTDTIYDFKHSVVEFYK